ncbi:DsbA family protein [Candidatus Uhrbacteria bacterium]|nr:DsbA family protein [Candidatus Uhrbacteria bacterium]
MRKFWLFFTFIIIFSGVLFLFLLIKDEKLPRAIKKEPALPPVQAQSISSPQAVAVGPKNAKVTVVQFFDFQCPYSKQAAPVVGELINEYSDTSVRFEFRHLPLVRIHPAALPAAQAAMCAGEQGTDKFFKMYNLIFKNQEKLSESALSDNARELQLNLSQYNSCMAQGKYQGNILKDLMDSGKLKLEGTPTFFINSIPVVGAYPKDVYSDIIDQELAK